MKLSFKISGIIRKIYADEGMSVRKGQILAMLDLSEINSQVKQAQSAFEKARRDLERVESLYQKKAATLEQYQNVQTAFQVAQSRLNAAEFNLRYSEIRAPSRGRILKRLMEENELAGAGMPVFFFASTEQDWIVRVGVSDRDLVRLRLDDPALVAFDAYPGEKFKAKVTEIVESADQMTGTYEVELKVDPAGKRLVSGFVAKVDIIPSLERTYYVIPIEALVEGNGRSGYVFAVDTGEANVQLGTAADANVYAQLNIPDAAADLDFYDETDDTNAIISADIAHDTLLRVTLTNGTDGTAVTGQGIPFLWFELHRP